MSRLLQLITRHNIVLLVTLTALACLPFAVRRLAPEATVNLLLPVLAAGAVLAWWLAALKLERSSLAIIYFLVGPLVIFIAVGGLARLLFETTFLSLQVLPQALEWLRSQSPIDLNAWLAAQREFVQSAGALASRITAWAVGRLRGEAVQDPAARAFAWSLGLWLIAVWTGSQVRATVLTGFRLEKSALIALLPATALLAWVLRTTSQLSPALWIYLTAAIVLLALTQHESLARFWRARGMDYSESIWEDTLLSTAFITAAVIVASYLAYSVSLEDIRDRIREWDERRSRGSTAESASGADGPSSGAVTGPSVGRVHTINAGPLLSTDIVMIVATGDLPAVPLAVDLNVPYYYWRTMTYQGYMGTGWTNPVNHELELQGGEPLMQVSLAQQLAGYRVVHQDVTFIASPQENLFWTGALLQADTSVELTHRGPRAEPASSDLDPLMEMDVTGALTSAETYSADSLISDHSENHLRASRPIYPAWVTQRYLTLPDTVPDRVLALARELTATAATPYDRAVAIETYLRQFPYTLDVPGPPSGRDVADYFLFDLQKGYCDYFATAMTVLARAAGLPARFVVGYASGEYNSLQAHYVVTQSDSHAWTEIYFAGIGWVEFEPTPSQPTPLRAGGVDVPAVEPPESAPLRFPTLTDFMATVTKNVWRAATLGMLLYLGWMASEGLRLSRLDPPQTLRHIYRQLRRATRAAFGSPPPSQTPSEYAQIVSARLIQLQAHNRVNRWLLAPAVQQAASLIGLYAQDLFSPKQAERADARAATRTWMSLRWRLMGLKVLTLLRLSPRP